ncbi:zinc-binding protein A33-like [Chiloscyllium plagiosum]|uniref:zinc-binding protein A33-like n=1 Tax=Chiloscyllium plagiosum TaxID=36176 RepID=UPI001CB809AF|nr:zinc-binding protein A33-like [Chiloscyllium plagiosum]
MDSSQQFPSLDEDLICPICLHFFTEPVTLDCGHNFCRSCITQSWEKKEINSCPECRQEFPERNLRVNRTLASLAEKVRTSSLNPQEKESKRHCEKHQEELKLFCETDKKLICLICRDSREHREHRFIPIKETVDIYKEKVKRSFDSLTKKKTAFTETELKQKRKISKMRKLVNSLRSHIKSEFTKIHQFLNEKEQRLLGDLREEEEKVLEAMEKNLQEIQKNLNSIQENLSKLQKQMEQKDEVLFIEEEASRKRRISDESHKLSLADGTLMIGKFTGPLQYTAWREMIDVIKPVPASLTLDPNTAHPDFVMNEERTSVRLRDNDSFLVRTLYKLKRFDPSLSVRGSDGFTAGKHYWEVQVGDGICWAVGVTEESTQRQQGYIPDSEAGFWYLWGDRFGRYFVVSSPSQTPLPLTVRPWKIGVFLDCEGGQVSFYNADNMSLLHIFTQTFTKRIFPFYRPGLDKKPLRICGMKSH